MKILNFLEKRPYTILLLLLVLVSVHSLKYNFLFIDDTLLIVNNPKLGFSVQEIAAIFSNPFGQIFAAEDYHMKFIYYRPALSLLYMFNNAIWGINPVGFHLTNLCLHLFTTIFIYRTGLILFNNDKVVSLIAASLFCVHPVHNELIGRVAMNENLLGFFIVTAIYFYLCDKKYLSLSAFAMALLSKESAIMLPFALFLLEIKAHDFKKTLTSLSPFIKILGVYLVVRTMVVGVPDDIQMNPNWLESLFTACSALADYIRLLFIPYPLSFYYPAWKFISPLQPDLLVSFAICLLLGFAAWKWRADRLLSPLLLGTVVMLAPVVIKANELILGGGRAYIAERQLYVPAIFFSLLIAAIIRKYIDLPARIYVVAALMGLMPVLIYTMISMSKVWENDEILASRFMLDFPNLSLSHTNRGEILFKRGDLDGALSEFEAALPSVTSGAVSSSAHTIKDAKPGKIIFLKKLTPADQSSNGGNGFKSLANFLDRYGMAAYQPEYANVHFQMGRVYLAKNETDRAIRKFKAALVLQPHNIEARSLLARLYLKKGLFQDARREFKLALKEINL